MLRTYLVSKNFELWDQAELELSSLPSKPDLIVMDNALSGSSGVANCLELKGDERTAHIPIILMSASPIEEDCKNAGAFVFLAKPFELKQLLAAINDGLETRQEIQAT